MPQDDPLPAQGLHDCVSGGRYQIHETIRAPHVLVEEHVRRTIDDHAPGTDARRSRDDVEAREGAAVNTGPPAAASHAEAGASVAPTLAAGATTPKRRWRNIIRTCLLWEKEGTVSSSKCNG